MNFHTTNINKYFNDLSACQNLHLLYFSSFFCVVVEQWIEWRIHVWMNFMNKTHYKNITSIIQDIFYMFGKAYSWAFTLMK